MGRLGPSVGHDWSISKSKSTCLLCFVNLYADQTGSYLAPTCSSLNSAPQCEFSESRRRRTSHVWSGKVGSTRSALTAFRSLLNRNFKRSSFGQPNREESKPCSRALWRSMKHGPNHGPATDLLFTFIVIHISWVAKGEAHPQHLLNSVGFYQEDGETAQCLGCAPCRPLFSGPRDPLKDFGNSTATPFGTECVRE